MEKICKKCRISKPLTEYYKEARVKCGYKSRCKSCTEEYQRDWLKSNPEFGKKKHLRYYKENLPAIKERAKVGRLKFKERINSYARKYFSENKEKVNESKKSYYHKNREKILERRRIFREENRDLVKQKRREYQNNKRKSCSEYRLKMTIRNLIFKVSKNLLKGRSELKLGYGYKEFINYFGRAPELNESVDHKIPISWFLLMDCKIINDLRNLQLIPFFDNYSKNNKYSHPVEKGYYDLIKDKLKPGYLHKIEYYG